MNKRVKIMKDGTVAVLAASGEYYIRQMYKGKSNVLGGMKWDRIEYYDLRGNYIPLASIECKHCSELIQSQYCGHYITCSCGRTACDTDRFSPERHRFLTN